MILIQFSQMWYQNSERYRDNDLLAIRYPDNSKHWYRNGIHHRANDKPAIIWANNVKDWYQNGKYIKED